MRPPIDCRRRPGFTLIELLVVIVILAILVGLLVPAIAGAVRSAKNAAVSAEINQLANGLENFKTKYGDYPPSRIILSESGVYNLGAATAPANAGTSDITNGQLAQRSVSYLRRFWPLVQLSTNGGTVSIPTPSGGAGGWYDFNGNGTNDGSYLLQGHECLVFFLGGIPLNSGGMLGMTGFGKYQQNPFSNSIPPTTGHPSPMYSQNRNNPFFEFRPNQLYLDPYDGTTIPGIPGYYDSLGSGQPTANTPRSFYAYFSAYGNNNYDPNDVNFTESDNDVSPAVSPTTLTVYVTMPTTGGVVAAGSPVYSATSPSPNPYSSSSTVPSGGAVTYQKPNSFQILSPGVDGTYGVGGIYSTANTSNSLALDSASAYAAAEFADSSLRLVEKDNIANFKATPLGQ